MSFSLCIGCQDLPDGPLCAEEDGTRDLARLAHGYLRHDHLDAVDHTVAFACVFSMECEAPEEALRFVFVAHALVKNEEERAYLAAGPLERLLVRHGPLVVERIVTKARQEPLFRRCLAGVWGRESMHPEVAARVDEILSPVVAAAESAPAGKR